MTSQQAPILNSISIQNYRAFSQEQKINFAVSNGKAGSGLTVITGANNSGKTSVIEALMLRDGSQVLPSERHTGRKPIIKIKINDNQIELTTRKNDFTLKAEPEGNGNILGNSLFTLLSYERDWDSLCTNESNSNLEQAFSNAKPRKQTNNDGEMWRRFAGFLKKICENDKQKEELTTFLQSLIPNFSSWSIDINDSSQEYIKYSSAHGTEHRAGFLGTGVISLFKIGVSLLEDKNKKSLIIDEPELSLHPTAQKKLSQIIMEKSKNRQIILCTHSPYFIDWECLKNGGKFYRLNKHDDKECSVHELKLEHIQSINGYEEYNRPHILDVTAKEIMFADKLLFVEGQTDVGIIKNWAKKEGKTLAFELFGYGVNGWNNFHLFAKICKELGLSKAAFLYDKGTEKDQDSYRNNITLDDDLEQNKQKYPQYCFQKLPTEDIVDEKNKARGCFDKKGDLKPEYQEEFERIMEEFNKYFTPVNKI